MNRGSAIRPWGSGPAQVGLGLGVLGVTTYVFLGAGAHTMGVSGYSDFAVFWGLVYGLGIGVCLPFEQEMSRHVARARALDEDPTSALREAYRLGAGVVVATGVLTAISALVIGVQQPWRLAGVTVVALAALMGAYISRGVLAGEGRWSAYSTQLATEGLVRILWCVTVVWLGVTDTSTWALAVPMALVAGACTSRRTRAWTRLQPSTGPVGMLPALLHSMGAVVIGQSLINFGPLMVRLLDRGSGDHASAGRFLAAMTLARIPVFLFAAVQPVLVPGLSRAVEALDDRALANHLRRGTACVALLGAGGLAGSLTVGPYVLGLLGPEYAISRADLALISLAVTLYLGALTLQPAAVALGEHRNISITWGAAGSLFLLVCLLPVRPILGVEVALMVACGVACTALATTVRRGSRGLGQRPIGKAS